MTSALGRDRAVRIAWIAVVVILALRLLGALTLPLTGDEAYYWEWSQRPAFGYVDHPPGVAWTIAAFAAFGRSAFVIRFGFWLCGCIATLAAADAARRLSDGRRRADVVRASGGRAAACAALLLSLMPIATVALTTASPDAPYLAAWALALDLAAVIVVRIMPSAGAVRVPDHSSRAVARGRARVSAMFPLALGIAMGACLLSRAFAAALLVGVVIALRCRPTIAALVAVVATLVFAPHIWWNAHNDWATFRFTFAGRHVNEGFSLLRPITLLAELMIAYSPGVFLAMLFLCAKFQRMPALLAWTGLPLAVFMLIIACFERVEVYWFLGPAISLAIALGVAVADMSPCSIRARIAWVSAPAVFLLCILFSVIISPLAILHALVHGAHVRLHNSGPFEVFTYTALSHDVARVANDSQAVVVTDGYGLSSLLDHDAHIRPVVIGYDHQGAESRRWYRATEHPTRLLFVDKEPLADRPDFAARFAQACARVRPGPTFTYPIADAPPRIYSTTWCERLAPNALALLRWETYP